MNIYARYFADDCVLYRNIRGSENQQLLQDDLEKTGSLREGMAHEIQCRQMSPYESDTTPPS